MDSDTRNNDNGNSFEYRLREVSDEEIINIIRYRNHYQPHAFKAAIKEALKRGIIQTIDDLDKDEFLPIPVQTWSLFPLGTSKTHTLALFKSLCRTYYGIALIPLIYGVFALFRGNFVPGIATLLTTLIIIFLIYQLEKNISPFIAHLLLALNVPVIGYAVYYLSTNGNQNTMDAVAIAIVVLVLLYTSFYLNKLTSYLKPDNQEED
ncbi:hypothetical protein [Roseimarinus sediminis]|uniref:hypothetical protein n=1 Tax=Roseimarinus sediminis TaxID=1610899 RepID=UPI003D2602EF